jgi:ATP-dependent RNA helicase RhlE
LIKVNVKTIKDHPFPWKDEIPNPDAKPDLRHKKKPEGTPNSRKSEASKKNKKRWY